MKTRIINVLLTFIVIGSTTFFTKADQVVIRKTKSTGGIRSMLLEPSHLTVNLDNNTIHIDFLFLLRDVNIFVVSSYGRRVYQQTVSSQTFSVNMDLSKEESGIYTIYFTDGTGVCLCGSFII